MYDKDIEKDCKKFVEDLNKRQPFEKVKNADRDFESMMVARDRRTNKYGITIVESFTDWRGYSQTYSYRDNRYIVTKKNMHLTHTIGFKKNNAYIYQHDSYLVNANMDVIDLFDSSKLPSEAYICPNCGFMSSAEELASSGCSSCGTHFSIPQLYPKISHFSYTEEQTDLNKDVIRRIKNPIFITWAIAYFPLFFLGLGMLETGIAATIIVELALMAVAGIPAFVVYAILTYVVSVKTMFDDKRARDQRKVTDRTTSKSTDVFENAMSKYGPVFNFPYFSSRVYNLLGSMIYAENTKECPFYSGPDFIGKFDTIIDYVPVGMDILSFNVDDNGKCTICAKVISDIYTYVNNKITHRKAHFTLKASKNMNYPIDINFSVHTYNCDGCGSSYDVTKESVCPYCGRPHDLLDEEWYIDGTVIMN